MRLTDANALLYAVSRLPGEALKDRCDRDLWGQPRLCASTIVATASRIVDILFSSSASSTKYAASTSDCSVKYNAVR